MINLLFGIFMVAWEWPLGFLAGSSIHRSIEARLALLPLVALSSALLYQGTNPAIYYVVALGVYFWAYSEGEVSNSCTRVNVSLDVNMIQIICAKPWTLPQRARPGAAKV